MNHYCAEYISTEYPNRTKRVEVEAEDYYRAHTLILFRFKDIRSGTLRMIKETEMDTTSSANKDETLFFQLRDILALPGARAMTHDQVMARVRNLVSIEQGARKCMPLNPPDALAGNFTGCFAEAVRIAAHEAVQRSPLNAEVTALKAELAEAVKKTTTKPPSSGAIKERKKKVESIFRELLITAGAGSNMVNSTVKTNEANLKHYYTQAEAIVKFLESQP